MFSRKLDLIERHLKDEEHPLAWLHNSFSTELKEYYELFLEVNAQCQSLPTSGPMNVSQRSYKQAQVDIPTE